MNDNRAASLAAAVATLRVAWPRQEFPDESVKLYVRALRDLDPGLVTAAVERLVQTSKWLPSVNEIREQAAELTCRLPTASEAWTIMLEQPFSEWPDVLVASVRACGGRWHIVHSERTEMARAQFIADYNERRRARIDGVTAPPSRRQIERQIVESLEDDTLYANALPRTTHTERMPPRPVWARWLLRNTFASGDETAMHPPTDAEKHDAILVLGEHHVLSDNLLHAEAQRILDEATP